jgi:hypothetical protein
MLEGLPEFLTDSPLSAFKTHLRPLTVITIRNFFKNNNNSHCSYVYNHFIMPLTFPVNLQCDQLGCYLETAPSAPYCHGS